MHTLGKVFEAMGTTCVNVWEKEYVLCTELQAGIWLKRKVRIKECQVKVRPPHKRILTEQLLFILFSPNSTPHPTPAER